MKSKVRSQRGPTRSGLAFVLQPLRPFFPPSSGGLLAWKFSLECFPWLFSSSRSELRCPLLRGDQAVHCAPVLFRLHRITPVSPSGLSQCLGRKAALTVTEHCLAVYCESQNLTQEEDPLCLPLDEPRGQLWTLNVSPDGYCDLVRKDVLRIPFEVG